MSNKNTDSKDAKQDIVGAINGVSTQLELINANIKKICEHNSEESPPKNINIKDLATRVDSVFEKTKDSFKEKNYGFPQIILSMLLLAAAVLSAIILAVLLYFYNQEQIAYIDIVSLAASSIAVFFASVSLIKQIRDSDKVTFDDKVNARYKRALADNPEIRMAEEKAIIKALIMLRTKNEDLPLTDVYKPDLPIFEKERLLERAYS